MIRTINRAWREDGYHFFMGPRLHRSCEVCKDVVAPIDSVVKTALGGALCIRCAVRIGVVEVGR